MLLKNYENLRNDFILSTSFFFNSRFVLVQPEGWKVKDDKSCELNVLGKSRENRDIIGFKVGKGNINVSIVAGAHSDEPVGPRTALFLAEGLLTKRNSFFKELHDRATWWIVPHVNPDGEIKNVNWMNDSSGDFRIYSNNVFREKPGDDVEFCYPQNQNELNAILNAQVKKTENESADVKNEKYSTLPRPENLAVANFLGQNKEQFHLHLSLHSMAVANGAWYLVCREWADRWRASNVSDELIATTKGEGLPLHDWDRKGDKGFTGIAPGFSTTPRSEAMQEFFLNQDDPVTASKFRPSSMEFVQSFGGDPLCLVSELPRYVIGNGKPGEPSKDLDQFLEFAKNWRKSKETNDEKMLDELIKKIPLKKVSFETHARLQLAFILAGLEMVENSTN